ncbi:unnamed protein product [Prorocentrum cordatum]|uniref:Uncharacterized protein n=1 Tax=Prorocentrum cordatum TaxID=2364126 RepID=A0ABN9VTZ1_9DINO|nr:unnamed protein product [Polarella glacialis]
MLSHVRIKDKELRRSPTAKAKAPPDLQAMLNAITTPPNPSPSPQRTGQSASAAGKKPCPFVHFRSDVGPSVGAAQDDVAIETSSDEEGKPLFAQFDGEQIIVIMSNGRPRTASKYKCGDDGFLLAEFDGLTTDDGSEYVYHTELTNAWLQADGTLQKPPEPVVTKAMKAKAKAKAKAKPALYVGKPALHVGKPAGAQVAAVQCERELDFVEAKPWKDKLGKTLRDNAGPYGYKHTLKKWRRANPFVNFRPPVDYDYNSESELKCIFRFVHISEPHVIVFGSRAAMAPKASKLAVLPGVGGAPVGKGRGKSQGRGRGGRGGGKPKQQIDHEPIPETANVPKQIKALMDSRGGDETKLDAILSKMTSVEKKGPFSAMRYFLASNSPSRLQEYTDTALTDTEKVRVITRNSHAPPYPMSKTEIKRTREDAVIDVWVTLDVLGGPLYLNNKEMMKGFDGWSAAASGSSSSAAAGALVDLDRSAPMSKEEKAEAKKKREAAKKAAELEKRQNEEQEFLDKIAHMPVADQEKEKAKRANDQAFAQAKKEYEAKYNEAKTKSTSFRHVCEVMVPQTIGLLNEKGCPDATGQYLKDEADKVLGAVKAFIEQTLVGQKLQVKTTEVEKATDCLVKVFKDFDSRVWSDLKKMSHGCAITSTAEALRPQVFEWAERIGISHADTDGMIMCGLWGDGAPYHTRDSLCMFTITALTGTRSCVHYLALCYNECKFWDPSESPKKLAEYARRHLILYKELQSTRLDSLCWMLKPKHHLFLEDHWEYADESCIGDAADLAETIHPSVMGTKLMDKYRYTFADV